MVHYSFPSYSTNEVGRNTFVSRREIGHGALAERGILPVMPDESEFPFSVRLSSDVLSSNGSSSMGAVCSGSLALMDAGVPIAEHVAGVSVGLMMDHDSNGRVSKYVLPVDIQGVEDALGDMDFKVAGTRNGVTAIQLDCKPAGIPLDILIEALGVAQKARRHIIDRMEAAITQGRHTPREDAPRHGRVTVPSNKLGAVIGPSGATVRELEQLYNCKVTVDDTNCMVGVFAHSKTAFDNAMQHIERLTSNETAASELSPPVQAGETVQCRVEELRSFGAKVKCIAPHRSNEKGLLHISEVANERISSIEQILKPQQVLDLRCLERTEQGLRFTRKQLLQASEDETASTESNAEVGMQEGQQQLKRQPQQGHKQNRTRDHPRGVRAEKLKAR